MTNSPLIVEAVATLKQGGILAYPTEAVFGLGCDPMQEAAVMRILALKQRPVAKGLIVIVSDWQQVANWSEQPIDAAPGLTWLVSATTQIPTWIRGQYNSFAVRLSQHPICQQLCQAFGGPIVSTSANIATQPPARSVADLQHSFPDGLDMIVGGELGDAKQVSSIRDLQTGEIVRP